MKNLRKKLKIKLRKITPVSRFELIKVNQELEQFHQEFINALQAIHTLMEAHKEYNLLTRNDLRAVAKVVTAMNIKNSKKLNKDLQDTQGMFG